MSCQYQVSRIYNYRSKRDWGVGRNTAKLSVLDPKTHAMKFENVRKVSEKTRTAIGKSPFSNIHPNPNQIALDASSPLLTAPRYRARI